MHKYLPHHKVQQQANAASQWKVMLANFKHSLYPSLAIWVCSQANQQLCIQMSVKSSDKEPEATFC